MQNPTMLPDGMRSGKFGAASLGTFLINAGGKFGDIPH
ncbi:hypothetical protein BH24PSE2_BH24PSE2_21220 [soil metagenome]